MLECDRVEVFRMRPLLDHSAPAVACLLLFHLWTSSAVAQSYYVGKYDGNYITAGFEPGSNEELSSDEVDGGSLEALQKQVQAQAEELDELRSLLEQHTSFLGSQSSSAAIECDAEPTLIERVPLVAELPPNPTECDDGGGTSGKKPAFKALNYYVDYDRGFVVRPFDPDLHLFNLKANGWIQFRHHAFDRDVVSWTDNAGVTRPVRSRSAFDIERARLNLSGNFIDERLSYFLQLDPCNDFGGGMDCFEPFSLLRQSRLGAVLPMVPLGHRDSG